MISAITIWEIAMLAQKERMDLGIDVMDWVEEAMQAPGPLLTPLSPKIAIQSTRLPASVHGDSADRILIATAREENAILATCDKKLLKFGLEPFINVINPMS